MAFVDTGHTHYNEVLNDGAVIYAATRSTGQIEEGPPGFSIGAVDEATASWRFKPLGSAWPFVLITSPGDVRMTPRAAAVPPEAGAPLMVRAKVFGADVAEVVLQVDAGPRLPMTRVGAEPGLWCVTLDAGLSDGSHELCVSARAAAGGEDRDVIRIRIGDVAPPPAGLDRDHLGDHRHSLGAWPEHGLLGTQLGPNMNGKAW